MKERPCIKCGSIERNSNGDCAPCQRACSAEWKRKNKEAIIASGEPRFYTYIHRRADDGNVFYVGKGNGDRCKSYKDRNNYWKRIVNKHGITIEIVAKFKTEEEAFAHEKYLISQYRGTGARLCNLTDGGDGPCGYRHTEETRQKLSSMQIGKTLSDEHKAKLSVALKGKPRPPHVIAIIKAANIGRKRTPEQNRINSEQRKGKKLHPDTVKKIVAANTGKKRSLEARKKMSIAAKKRGISAETLLKAHLATRGKKRSEEFCAKISAALTGRIVSNETREKLAAKKRGNIISQEIRDKISKTLTGRTLPEAAKAKIIASINDPERRARHSAALKGRPWSEARRAAQNKNKT